MRKIDKIIIHCADTPEGKYFDIEDIRDWHLQNGWSDVGYHFVILLDGTIQIGRTLDKIGAHTKGYNSNSIGVCYIGGAKGVDTRTNEQKTSLIYLIGALKRMFKADVYGHRDFSNKECPSFDAKTEYEIL
jgi:N-acetylmuramoyl-L-alanine amidase